MGSSKNDRFSASLGENFLGIIPLSNATSKDRRTGSSILRLSLFGEPPTYQVVYDFLSELLGELFVTLVQTSSSEANGSVPTDNGTGISIPGGVDIT